MSMFDARPGDTVVLNHRTYRIRRRTIRPSGPEDAELAPPGDESEGWVVELELTPDDAAEVQRFVTFHGRGEPPPD